MIPLWIVGSSEHDLSSMFSLLWMFGVIIAFGVLLNVFVIARLSKLAKKDKEQFMSGTGVYLYVMAFADIVSLVFIFSHLSLQVAAPYIPPVYLHAFCKGFVFFAHCSYTMSMYCWLFMSGLRYLAAMHPLHYGTVWRSPMFALGCVTIVGLLLNLHVLVAVGGSPELGCALSNDTMSSVYNLADIVISCLVPSLLILYMDMRVLCCRTNRRNSDPLLQIVFHKADEESEKRRAANMKRFMAVTSIGLLLSLPEVLLRAVRTVTIFIPVPPSIFFVAKTLYFIKFSFNAFYLTSYVFDRNVLSKTSSSRQLSISARRLEECPAITQRERSLTMTYRANTPVPLLTRNSSCFNLDASCESPSNWV